MHTLKITYEGLYQAYIETRKGKRLQHEVQAFEFDLGYSLAELYQELTTGRYTLGKYRTFFVKDPKMRKIDAYSYKDRLVNHYLVKNHLIPQVEPLLIEQTSACRKGKGTTYAREEVKGCLSDSYTQCHLQVYILRMDIKKYYDSINHTELLTRLKQDLSPALFKWMALVINAYQFSADKGIPIGSESSQWLGNYYLSNLDHYIKNKLGITYYHRYMDDMILVHESKTYLQQCLQLINGELNKLDLELHERKTQLVPLKNGVEWLGWRYTVSEKGKVSQRLPQKVRRRIINQLKRLPKDGLYHRRLDAYCQYSKAGNHYYFRTKCQQLNKNSVK